MNILKEYTLDYVRCNKKSSTAIMIAILIATIILSALSGFLYTMYTDEIRLTILEKGDWHAELFDKTPGDKLKYVTGHPNVQAVMIKGTWETAKIDDPRRPYLAMRALTANYWNYMPEHDLITEGHVPKSENELAISKQYFENHPDLKIGDTINIPIGNRTFNSEILDPLSVLKDSEGFVPTEERTYTVVGKLDAATNSVTPAYFAYGYMKESSIKPNDELTVYIHFENPRTTYQDIIQIAKSVGYKPDEYGNYLVKTNSSLLSKYFIFPSNQLKDFDITQLSMPLMFLALALLVTALFVFIINNAFAMSANARLKQLGMFQSIGASQKQIRRSLVFESLILSIIPIPLGLCIGRILDYGLFTVINSVESMRDIDIIFTFGLPAVLPSVLFALITVWLSAVLPARKITRLSPIEAIRQGSEIKVKKIKKHWLITKAFGIEGELGKNALYARRKSYRTAAISLTLSFLLLSTFLTFIAIVDARNEIFNPNQKRDLMINTLDGNLTDLEFEKEISSINGLESIWFYNDTYASLWLTADMQSEELLSIGGLKRIADDGKYEVYQKGDRFRIQTTLLSVDDLSFNRYCKQIGADPSQFYNANSPRTIVINEQQDDIKSNRRNDIRIPFLKLKVGDKLNCEEKVYEEDTSQYTFKTEVGFLTNQIPPTLDSSSTYNKFQLMQIMPRSTYLNIVKHFEENRRMSACYGFAHVLVQSENLIQPVADRMEEICNNWYGSGDYYIWNILEVRKTNDNSQMLLKIVILFISGFLALIGISNVFSTVSGNLRQRQKEFAVLRSVGLPPKGIRRMLTMEALFFGLIPILLSIPVNVIIIGLFLEINMIYISEFLPYMPLVPIIAFGAIILLSILLAYTIGGRKINRDAIVEVLKDEAV